MIAIYDENADEVLSVTEFESLSVALIQQQLSNSCIVATTTGQTPHSEPSTAESNITIFVTLLC